MDELILALKTWLTKFGSLFKRSDKPSANSCAPGSLSRRRLATPVLYFRTSVGTSPLEKRSESFAQESPLSRSAAMANTEKFKQYLTAENS